MPITTVNVFDDAGSRAGRRNDPLQHGVHAIVQHRVGIIGPQGRRIDISEAVRPSSARLDVRDRKAEARQPNYNSPYICVRTGAGSLATALPVGALRPGPYGAALWYR
jgi:hypothetical protein